ncbi:hypothetical protein HF086_002417, partial [Spodoptera exigua]
TQNIDGSPLKEVQCVRCARGFKPVNNVCTRCESCACAKNQIIVRGLCIPKTYVNSRPKYEENSLHPLALLDVVKHEYLCMQNDLRACHTLANECVRNFYSTDTAGPCRLWIQPKLATPKALPRLIVESSLEDKNPGETYIGRRKQDSILIAAAVFSSDGRFKFMKDANQDHTSCRLPVKIRIGRDFSRDCIMNVSKLTEDLNETISPYLYSDGKLVQIPVYPRKPNGHPIQKGTWISSKFKRFFIMDRSLSIVTNTTNYVFLRTMDIKLQIERDKASPSYLRVQVSVEVSYVSKSPFSESVVTTLKVTHVMPEAGVHRGLEIWGGVLGCLLTLYAMVQWRGVVRRGGLYISVLPLMAAAISDTFYFAIKVAWFNFKQCRCDVFFLDWSEYNPPYKGAVTEKYSNWRASTLAREWSRMQTMRRVSPGYTASLALLVLHVRTRRNDDSKDLRSIAGPLAACRVVCAPQLRIVYKQLTLSIPGINQLCHNLPDHALDGLSWVASERTVLERLLNVELNTREAGNTSTLLYDPDESTPSCFAVTW